MAEYRLQTPLTEAEVRKLRAGDLVYLSGKIFTARDQAHRRALELRKRGQSLPLEVEGLAVYHCGPLARRVEGRWELVAAGPTTSTRMNPLEPEFIKEFKVRAVIGKGGMNEATAQAMRKHGCVYLAFTGGCAVLAVRGIKHVSEVHWLDLGMPEALWVLEVKEFGPLVVGIDAHGRSLFHEVQKQAEENLDKLLKVVGRA